MDGEYLVGKSVTLVLPVLLAGVGFLWLRARQELGHLKQLFDDLPNPILRIDLVSFEPLICNRAFSRLLGYADNLECVALFTAHPHLPQQNFYQIYRLSQDSTLNGNGGLRTDIVLRDRQGNMVNQHLAVLLDKNNRYMDIVLDHSGSDRPEREDATGGDILLQQNLLAYLKLDQNLNIVSFNQASKELFALQAGDDLTLEDVFPSGYSERLVSIYRRRLTRRGNLILRQNIRIGAINKKGQWNISKDPAEEYYHAFFCLDATNSFLETPVSNLLDVGHGVWELDHRTGLLVHNESWLDYLGYRATENIDKLSFWFSVISPDDRKFDIESIQAATMSCPFKIQYKMASGRGVELDIETRGFVVERDADGNAVLSRGIHIDVTRSRVNGLEKETHHQLMNQLASILGYADMIRTNDHIPIEVKGFAQEVLTNGEKIRDLLSTADQNQPGTGASIKKIADRHRISIVGNSFLQSSVAESELEEIIRLVLQFMINEGDSESKCKLSISNSTDARCSACTQDPGTSYVCLNLEQDGLHIDRKHFLHLLEPGFMTSSIGQENTLPGACELVHNCGGHFSLSLKGSGFAVTLYLPETSLPELQQPEPYRSEPDKPGFKPQGQGTGDLAAQADTKTAASTGRNILIIDDEISVANYLKKIVQKAGYRVTVFTESEAALKHFRHDPYNFDLVITDQSMPGYSGDAIMLAMLEQNPRLPIIMCTGYSQTENAAAARKAGAVGFVTKPVRASQLIETIERSIGSVQ